MIDGIGSYWVSSPIKIAALKWPNVDMVVREIAFFRPKTGIITRQRLTHGLYDALVAYADVYPLPKTDGALIVVSESYRPVLARRGLTLCWLADQDATTGSVDGD